jgi:transcriptional antiterminator NusG
MEPHEVEKLLGEMERTQEKPKVKIEFQKGESVKIKEGPFESFEGIVDEVLPDKGLVKVVVTIFGRPTPVELEYWQVEAI